MLQMTAKPLLAWKEKVWPGEGHDFETMADDIIALYL